ncbi:class II aldolase/adducin family protein [Pelagicoccus sp. SDUM812005]|uniref:class II aldolase/adducin family protein n=1 Tax=Pelagicoccus sp. SDUM812005 TaxID=3041257 RepID=UPI00280C6986|nr:class II aldolase/adducin family protein [Pelagicoccus sp. SDUM812005]MDQ8180020.1 class II aldolase/adducin family protein [Pelagicoccus sp. SDUM812005]
MKKVLTESDIEALLAQGKGADAIPAGTILTPSAKDRLKLAGGTVAKRSSFSKPAAASAAPAGNVTMSDNELFGVPVIPNYEYTWTPGQDPKTRDEIRAFYFSPEITTIRENMALMGKRMWEREYTDGNGGNLTVRVGDNLALCTPTLICKGFMKADDMALIDLDGNQIAGRLKRTSEAMTHLAIMKRQPKAKACCHAHPPHATAYAVAKVQPPTCLIPEAEVFLGQIGVAEYRTPGSPENAEEVGTVAIDHMSVLMINHGVITWGKDIEDAYWKMENTESYCKTVWVASMLGKKLDPIKASEAKTLIELRKSLGMDDKREGWKECELCDNSDFRPGFFTDRDGGACQVACGCDSGSSSSIADAEELVKTITAEIQSQLGK